MGEGSCGGSFGAVLARTPPPNPLPQGEGAWLVASRSHPRNAGITFSANRVRLLAAAS